MAVMTTSATLHWPKPQDLVLQALRPSYDRDLDLLVLSFVPDAAPRVEVQLESIGGLTPLASVRLGSRNKPTDEVIGVMVENLSEGFDAHPAWRMLAEDRIDRAVLTSLIETFAPLREDAKLI